jgi:hypothetical protein
VEQRRPNGFTINAFGELEGTGIWTFEQDGDFVSITFDWQVSATKPLLKHSSFILKPLFSWNHDWVMNRGERHLQTELDRRKQLIAS